MVSFYSNLYHFTTLFLSLLHNFLTVKWIRKSAERDAGVKKRQTYFENSDAETRKLAKI